MNNATNHTNPADAFIACMTGMIEARKQYATDNGFTATEDEIAAHVAASLVRMMKAEVAR